MRAKQAVRVLRVLMNDATGGVAVDRILFGTDGDDEEACRAALLALLRTVDRR
jgi:hypothetical protein